MSRNDARTDSHIIHKHWKQKGTVVVKIRETQKRKGNVDYNIDAVEVCLTNRNPYVENVMVFNINRAINDLTQIRDDIVNQGLYMEKDYEAIGTTKSGNSKV